MSRYYGLQILPEEYVALLRNKEAIDVCAPLLYITLIDWSCSRPQDETFENYIKDNAILEQNGLFSNDKAKNDWKEKHMNQLNVTDLNGYDTTFLLGMLPIACHGKITDKERSFLNDIKCMKNDVSHDQTKAKDPKYFNELRSCISKCLMSASSLFRKGSNEIDNITKEIDEQFDKIFEDINQNHRTKKKYIKELIMSECVKESVRSYGRCNFVCLPVFSNMKDISRSAVFHNVKISMNNSRNERITVRCTDIFENVDTSKVIVIHGIAGSGKGTFIKTILHDIIKAQDSSKFLMPILIECRMRSGGTLGDWMKRAYPDQLGYFPPHEVLDAMQTIDGFIILINGYDNVNGESRELVNEALSFSKNKNVIVIITGILHTANFVEEKLTKDGFKFQSVFMEPISNIEDKLEFLGRFGRFLPNCGKLVDKFEQLNETTKEVLNSPYLLALFCALYLERTGLNSSASGELVIYKTIIASARKNLEDILRDNRFNNIGMISENNLMKELSKRSLILFNQKIYYFTGDKLDDILKDTGTSLVVNNEEIFSGLFSPEYSLKSNKVLRYQFSHSSIQDYVICIYIKQYPAYSDASIKVTASNLLDFFGFEGIKKGGSSDKYYLSRCKNIIRFLIMKLHDNGNLSQFSNAIAEIITNFTVDDEFILNVIHATNFDTAVVKMLSRSIGNSLNIVHARHFEAVSELVKWWKLSWIAITIDKDLDDAEESKLQSVLGDVKNHFKGGLQLQLNYSYGHYKEIEEETLFELKDANCTLTAFRACVTSEKILKTLKKLTRKSDVKSLELSTPTISDHYFHVLEGINGHFKLSFKYAKFCNSEGSRPVPLSLKKLPPDLYLTDVPVDGLEDTVKIINFIAPKNKRFHLYLPRCELSSVDLNKIGSKLGSNEVGTSTQPKDNFCKIQCSSNPSDFCCGCNNTHDASKSPCYMIKFELQI